MPMVFRVVIQHSVAQLLSQDSEPALDGRQVGCGRIKGLGSQHGLDFLPHLNQDGRKSYSFLAASMDLTFSLT